MLPHDTTTDAGPADALAPPAAADGAAPGIPGPAPLTAEMRARMIAGLVQVIDEVGYGPSRVRDVARAARTSLTTFYLAYPSKDDCLVALAEQLQRDVEAWLAARAEEAQWWWPEVLHAAIRDGVTAMVGRPQLAYAMLVELGAAGESARRARSSALAALACAAADSIECARVRTGELAGRRLTHGEAVFVLSAVVECAIELLVDVLDDEPAPASAMGERIEALATVATQAIVRLAR